MQAAAADQAREALRLVHIAPRQSLRVGRQALRWARVERDRSAQATAERALGLAALNVGDLDTAISHLRAAVNSGRRAGSPQLAAEAQMSLAFALNRRGRARRALREIDAAVVHLDGVARARAWVQRAAIDQQLGRFDLALAGYRRALPTLRRAHDDEWVQRLLSNRAIVHVFQQSYAAAQADLREAAELCGRLGLDLAAAFVEENLAFVHARRGDVPAALHHLHRAEEGYHALGAPTGSLLVDRSELLLSVRLVAEARESAAQALVELERDHRRIAVPEARLLLARTAALDGDPTRALTEARRAVREFAGQGREGWAALARFEVLSARVRTERPVTVSSAQARRVADALDAAGRTAAGLDARLLVAQLALGRGRIALARHELHRVSSRRDRGPAALRARAWYGEALLRLVGGNRRGAVSAVATGLRILDEHWATLGATDLRASVAAHRTDLTGLALRIALQDGRPDVVIRWAERGRARHLLTPVPPPADAKLARDLAQLRATAAEAERHPGLRGAAGAVMQRQIALERSIRDHCRRRPGEAAVEHPPQPPDLADLHRTLGAAALVEFVELDEVLHAVTLTSGRAVLHCFGPIEPARTLVEMLSFALHRLARPQISMSNRAAATLLLRHSAERLDALLLGPLSAAVGDRPLVVVPTGPLQALPWSVLPSCKGRPVTVTPSAALWQLARQAPVVPGHVIAAAGPGLPAAPEEVEAVARIYGAAARTLSGAEATVDTVAAALAGASLAHLAAHGRVRADNPLFTSLQLADGPLTVYDLERLSAVPHTVVLAACDTGRPVVRAGDELLGLSASFLSQGTRQLVASVVPVPDVATLGLMTAMHRRLAAGTGAAEALALAQEQTAGEEPATMAAAAGFVCIGAGVALPASSTRSLRGSRAGG